jgi:hypothetical protein
MIYILYHIYILYMLCCHISELCVREVLSIVRLAKCCCVLNQGSIVTHGKFHENIFESFCDVTELDPL